MTTAGPPTPGSSFWDSLHDLGIRLQTNMRSKFPNFTYEISKDGSAFAVIETSGKYVHEDEAAEHKMNVSVGRYYYRVWTNSRGLMPSSLQSSPFPKPNRW